MVNVIKQIACTGCNVHLTQKSIFGDAVTNFTLEVQMVELMQMIWKRQVENISVSRVDAGVGVDCRVYGRVDVEYILCIFS